MADTADKGKGRAQRLPRGKMSDEQMVRLMKDLGLTEEQAREELRKAPQAQRAKAPAITRPSTGGAGVMGFLKRMFRGPDARQ